MNHITSWYKRTYQHQVHAGCICLKYVFKCFSVSCNIHSLIFSSCLKLTFCILLFMEPLYLIWSMVLTVWLFLPPFPCDLKTAMDSNSMMPLLSWSSLLQLLCTCCFTFCHLRNYYTLSLTFIMYFFMLKYLFQKFWTHFNAFFLFIYSELSNCRVYCL